MRAGLQIALIIGCLVWQRVLHDGPRTAGGHAGPARRQVLEWRPVGIVRFYGHVESGYRGGGRARAAALVSAMAELAIDNVRLRLAGNRC